MSNSTSLDSNDMSNNSIPSTQDVAVTYCDWRVTLNCESEIYKIVYEAKLGLLVLLAFICCAMLFYRLRVQKNSILSLKTPNTGRIRPNPIECFLIWELAWIFGDILLTIFISLDVFPNSYLVREALGSLYESFTMTGLAWFVVGTYSQIGSQLNHKTRPWRPNFRLTDRFLILTTVVAPITVCSVAAVSGYFRDTGNSYSDMLVTIHYMLLSVWSAFGAVCIFYFGRELCNVLRFHIEVTQTTHHTSSLRVKSMESGLLKIRITLYIIFCAYLYNVIESSVLGTAWVLVLTQLPVLNQILFVSHCFFMPLCITIILAIVSIRNRQTVRSYDGRKRGSTASDTDKTPIVSRRNLHRKKSKLVIRPGLDCIDTFRSPMPSARSKSPRYYFSNRTSRSYSPVSEKDTSMGNVSLKEMTGVYMPTRSSSIHMDLDFEEQHHYQHYNQSHYEHTLEREEVFPPTPWRHSYMPSPGLQKELDNVAGFLKQQDDLSIIKRESEHVTASYWLDSADYTTTQDQPNQHSVDLDPPEDSSEFLSYAI